jgi:hypothetical protein
MGARIIVDKETAEGHYIKAERFTKTMLEVWRYVNKHDVFTTAEEKTLHRLSMYLQLNTNAIVTTSGDYMSIEKMAEETNIDRSNIRKVIKTLMKKNALGMWKSGGREIYYMNPFLYQMGNVPGYLFNMFDEEYHNRCSIEHNLMNFKAGKKVTSILVVKPDKTEKTATKAG